MPSPVQEVRTVYGSCFWAPRDYSFPAMGALNVRSGDAFSLVFSAAEPDTLAEAQRLHEEIVELRRDERRTPVTVVANKADLREAISDAGAVCDWLWCAGLVEASVRTGENVLEVFRDLLSWTDVPSRTVPRGRSLLSRKATAVS
ncbi:LOW QUALITY PROTEIN: RASD family member 3 [Sardina pilchardus]|uniref:LOW QUALITY PROTEIN: RASD family member 3 n=1 Tax=Sardina pilchardus TaxID=27697 RepID=UPI002E0FDB29